MSINKTITHSLSSLKFTANVYSSGFIYTLLLIMLKIHFYDYNPSDSFHLLIMVLTNIGYGTTISHLYLYLYFNQLEKLEAARSGP